MQKKLSLNRKTIVNLKDGQMEKLKGGWPYTVGPYNTCPPATEGNCDTDTCNNKRTMNTVCITCVIC